MKKSSQFCSHLCSSIFTSLPMRFIALDLLTERYEEKWFTMHSREKKKVHPLLQFHVFLFIRAYIAIKWDWLTSLIKK